MRSKTCQCHTCRSGRHGEFEDDASVSAHAGQQPFGEAEENELAMELLSVSSEGELDQFLGKVFKAASKGLKNVGAAAGKTAGPLGGVLKGLAKQALPFIGGALGSFIPIPGVGTAVGSALGSAVSKALEAELAGLELEERELEMARRFVRIAGTAAQEAALSPPSADLRAAVRSAVRRHIMSRPDFDIAPFTFQESADEQTWEAERRGATPPSARRGPPRPMRGRPRPGPRRPVRRPWPAPARFGEPAAASGCTTRRTEFVRWVQSALNQVDGAGLAVDGVMSAATRTALQNFQRRQGLPIDGIVGRDTEEALRKARRPAEAAAPPPEPEPEPAPADAGEVYEFETVELAPPSPPCDCARTSQRWV
jgi:peptidoglycan hydrolase-like protein with peptidoglycan-binding domain